MNRTSHRTHRAGRSNMYSESRFTNWAPFDPYWAEHDLIPAKLAPTRRYRIDDSTECRIYERPLHSAFLRPFDASDVEAVLRRLPQPALGELWDIFLLGGTSKQDRIAGGDLFRFGQYEYCRIFLYAFPLRQLAWSRKGPPRPDVCQEYARAGASFEQDGDQWICRFDERSLKSFYLEDVLIHEIGHHVDRHNLASKTHAQAERFAGWFVRQYGYPGRTRHGSSSSVRA